jgi:hypothetical protein
MTKMPGNNRIIYCGPADGVRDYFSDPKMPKTIGELMNLERYWDDPHENDAQEIVDSCDGVNI